MRRHFSRHSGNDDEKKKGKKGKNTRSAPALTLLVTPPQRSPWASSLPFSLALFCAQTIWYHLTPPSPQTSLSSTCEPHCPYSSLKNACVLQSDAAVRHNGIITDTRTHRDFDDKES